MDSKKKIPKLKEKIKYYECLFDGIESLLNSRKKSLVFMNDRFVNLIEIDLYDFGI
jgi:hypothetical protein